MTKRTCRNCGAPITGEGKTGRCRTCSARRIAQASEVRAKISATLSGPSGPGWKGGKPCCIDCGKRLTKYSARRCQPCAAGNGCRHGHYGSPTYVSWKKMKQRCSDPNDVGHPRYGGRGITVCERWLGPDGFVNFLADMGERPEGKTLDRIDPDGNYEPGNCRWATPKEQRANRSRAAVK